MSLRTASRETKVVLGAIAWLVVVVGALSVTYPEPMLTVLTVLLIMCMALTTFLATAIVLIWALDQLENRK